MAPPQQQQRLLGCYRAVLASNLLPAKPLQQKIRIPVRMVHLTARGLRWRLEAQTLEGVADGRGARAQARRPAARR